MEKYSYQAYKLKVVACNFDKILNRKSSQTLLTEQFCHFHSDDSLSQLLLKGFDTLFLVFHLLLKLFYHVYYVLQNKRSNYYFTRNKREYQDFEIGA